MSNSVNSNPFEKMAKLFANKELKRPTIDGLIDTASITEKEIETLFPQNQPANIDGIKLNNQDEEILKEIFTALDENEDGVVDEAEMIVLTELHDDNDNATTITQEDIDIFVEKAKDIGTKEEIVQKYNDGLDKILAGIFGENFDVETLSDEQIEKAIFLNSLQCETETIEQNIQLYFDTLGVADAGYDWLKSANLTYGLSKEDVEEYASNQREFLNLLSESLKTDQVSQETYLEKVMPVIENGMENLTTYDEIINYAEKYLCLDKEAIAAFLQKRLNPTNQQDGMFVKSVDGEYVVVDKNGTESTLSMQKIFNAEEYGIACHLIKFKEDLANYKRELITNTDEPQPLNFDDLYFLYTGVTYDQEAIEALGEVSIPYTYASNLQSAALTQEYLFANFTTPQDALDYFMQLSPTKEEAIKEFNQYYSNIIEKIKEDEEAYASFMITQNGSLCISSLQLAQDGETIVEEYTLVGTDGEAIEYSEYDLEMFWEKNNDGTYSKKDNDGYLLVYNPDTEKITREIPIGLAPTTTNNFASINYVVCDNRMLVNETIEAFDEEYGKGSFRSTLEAYQNAYQKAYGSNILNQRFEEYQKDMDTYSEKLSGMISGVGFALSFVNPAFGSLALAGTFTDDLIDAVNIVSNEVDHEIGPWMLSTLKEVGQVAMGMGLGAGANKAGNLVLRKLIEGNCSTGLAHLAGTGVEYAVDVVTGTGFDSLMSYFDTGNFNVLNNLCSNMLFGSSDLRGGIGAYRAMKAGESIDFGAGTLFKFDAETKTGEYSFKNSDAKVKMQETKVEVDGKLKNTKEWTIEFPDGTNRRITSNQTEIIKLLETGGIKSELATRYLQANVDAEKVAELNYFNDKTIEDLAKLANDGVSFDDAIIITFAVYERNSGNETQIYISASEIYNKLREDNIDTETAAKIATSETKNAAWEQWKRKIYEPRVDKIEVAKFLSELSEEDSKRAKELFDFFVSYNDLKNYFNLSHELRVQVDELILNLPAHTQTIIQNYNMIQQANLPELSQKIFTLIKDKDCNYLINKLSEIDPMYWEASLDILLINSDYTTYFNIEEICNYGKDDPILTKAALRLVANNKLTTDDVLTIYKNTSADSETIPCILSFINDKPTEINANIESIIKIIETKDEKIIQKAFELTQENNYNEEQLKNISSILSHRYSPSAIAALMDGFSIEEVAQACEYNRPLMWIAPSQPDGILRINLGGKVQEFSNITESFFKYLFPTANNSSFLHSYSKQKYNGDCYLLSSINALFENPNSIGRIINCFHMNENGKCVVSLPNGFFEAEILEEIMKKHVLKDDVAFNQYSQTSPGIQALEYIYQIERFSAGAMTEVGAYPRSNHFAISTMVQMINFIDDKGNFEEDPTKIAIEFREGGNTREPMSMFGYEDTDCVSPIRFNYTLRTINWDDYVFTASTCEGTKGQYYHDKESDIIVSHSYLIRPKKNNEGKIEIEIVNPHHSEKISCTMTLEDFKNCRYFHHIWMTKVK